MLPALLEEPEGRKEEVERAPPPPLRRFPLQMQLLAAAAAAEGDETAESPCRAQRADHFTGDGDGRADG